MWMPYKMITTQTSDEKFHSIIDGYYNDFKRFMQIKSLPPHIIKPNKSLDTTIFSVTMPKEVGQPYVFNVNKITYIALGQGALSGIYHEFTHIYDDCQLLCDYPQRRISIIPYTEFHATVVQMMIATGYTSYHSDKKISLNSKVVDGIHNCSLKEYFNKEYRYNKTKLAVNTSNLKQSFNYLYMLLLYHMGKMYFAQKYVKEDCSTLFSLESFVDIFGKEVILLQKLLFENDTSDRHLLLEAQIQNNIMQEFGKKYDK